MVIIKSDQGIDQCTVLGVFLEKRAFSPGSNAQSVNRDRPETDGSGKSMLSSMFKTPAFVVREPRKRVVFHPKNGMRRDAGATHAAVQDISCRTGRRRDLMCASCEMTALWMRRSWLLRVTSRIYIGRLENNIRQTTERKTGTVRRGQSERY